MKEPNLKILLLGPPAVYLEDKPVHITRKIVRALLFFLAGEHTFVSRNRIINTFWPEDSEGDARRHLREILSKLRSAIPIENALITDQDQVSLDFERIYVDMFEFSENIRINWSVLNPNHSKPLNPKVYKEMDRLIFLWRSPHFMAGFNSPDSVDFDIWVRKTGLSMENYRRQILKILAEDTEMRGDLITSLWWLKQAMDEDEFDADLQFHYMSTLQQLGRSRVALDFYAAMQELYQREGLGEIPTTLQELEKTIRVSSRAPVQTESIDWPGMLDLSIPFIGRKKIFDELNKAFVQGGCVILRGEAGLGKSRLAYELYHQILPRPKLFFAQGRSTETDLPFQPLIGCLRQTVTRSDWEKFNPLHRISLTRLIPELNSMETSGLSSNSSMGEQGRAAIFEAFHQLMLDFSRDRRVIFFMDDAHWCDQSSLDVLGYLQKRGFFEQHGLLLLAARVEEKDPMLESFLDNQPRSHLIRSFTLDQFGYSDVLQMADHLLGFTPSEAFAQRLLLDTGGNPLFLLETLHTLQKLGLDSDQINAARNLPVAGSIRILIRNRLNQLNDETRELLNTAAVMGNSFSIPILKKACPTKNMDFVLAIEELERVHLIQPAVNEFTGGKYSFIHEKIRESLLQDISQVRVKLLHDRVATAMEETGPTSQQAAVIAEHYQTAGNIHKAFHFWIEAGQYACFMLSPQEASRAFQNVEKLFLQTEVLLDIKEIHKLYILWAGLLEERNDTPGLANCYNKLIEWGRKRQAPLLVGSGYVGLSHLEILKVNPQRAMEYIQEAEIYLAQVDDKFETSKLYNQKGMIFQLSSNLDEAADAYQKSLQLTEGMLDQQILNSRAQLLTRLAMLGIFLCNTQIAMDTALENVRLGNQIGNHLATGWGYTMQTTAHYMVAEYEKGINAARSGIQVAGLIQNQHMLAYLNAGLGKNELDLGRLKDGWDHLNQSISLATEYKHFEVVSEAYVGLAEVYMDLRNFRKAYQIASEGTVCHQNNYQMYQNLLQCGLSHLLLGELDEGISKVNQVLTFAGKAGLNYIFYPALVCEAYLDIARGDMDSARTTLNIILEFCVPRNLLSQVYMCYWLLSSIARLKGDSRAALDLARKAGSLAKRMQNPWLEINILQMIAQMEKELKNDFSYERNRIQTLLTSISAGGIPPELQEDFNSFLQQIQIN